MNRRDFFKVAAAAGFGVMTNGACHRAQHNLNVSPEKSKSISSGRIQWTLDPNNPVVRPGQLNPGLDDRHAGAAHIVQVDDTYLMYYWGGGGKGNVICVAKCPVARPNEWKGLGHVLEPQPEMDYNCVGPSFPFVLPIDEKNWLMYFAGWGKHRKDRKLPNTTGLAISEDGGLTWRYHQNNPIIALDKPWDSEGTGSVSVVKVDNEFRMYYTSLGEYFKKPEGVSTGHGDVIPRIGIAYAVSKDGIGWKKPLDGFLVGPRGFGTEPYEYIVSKPFVMRDGAVWRMWVNTFGTAYRIRSLISNDGLNWTWVASGPDGDLGVGEPGAFDDVQRCYVSAIKHGSEYRLWYTGNGFGATGMGYAAGAPK